MTENERLQAEMDRDTRTVVVLRLHPKVTEHIMWDFFTEKIGKVNDARIIVDRVTKKSKGIGYVEFVERSSVQKALSMTGMSLLGMNLIIQHSQAEKNRAAGVTAPTMSSGPTRVYVGNLHPQLTEDDLRDVFSPFGSIEYVNLVLDPADSNKNKGFGFVQFRRPDDAKKALHQINGLEVAGKQLRVGLVEQEKHSGGGGGGGAHSGMVNDLDDDEGGGLKLSNTTRAALMARMQRSDDIASLQALQPAPQVPPHLVPSPAVLLKNMFDPVGKDQEFFEDIRLDVEDEAGKYGNLMHMYIDPNSADHVYLRFSTTEEAQRAHAQLNNRWFAGSKIIAEYIPAPQYDSRFSIRL